MEKEKSKATGLTDNENENNPNLPITNPPIDTYYEYSDENGGSFEFDLVSLREKGVPIEYVSIVINGIDIQTNPPVPNSAAITISTKAEFEKFKNFIAQLKWE